MIVLSQYSFNNDIYLTKICNQQCHYINIPVGHLYRSGKY